MSDQRPDNETLGRALGRAVETQSVRETPYAGSRLAREIDRPARGGWLGTLAVAAALGLFVAMGTFIVRGPFGVANPDPSASPTAMPMPTTGPPTMSLPPAASPQVAAPESVLVYFARDGLSPVGVTVSAPAPFRTLPTTERISARVRALWDARPAGSASILVNVFRPRGGSTSISSVTTTTSGDTATVVIDAGSWGALSSTDGRALIDQLVYTITEEPGIRRAAVREPGKDHAIIGNFSWRDPISREQVLRYRTNAPQIETVDVGDATVLAEVVDWRASIDDVAPGLGRFVVELRPTGAVPQFWIPRFSVRLEQGRNRSDSEPGKWIVRLTMPDAVWRGTPGQAFHCCEVKPGERTPIRQLSAYPLSGTEPRGVGFDVDLDDARPWRATVLQSPPRVVVDIGGPYNAVSDSIAVYGPRAGDEVPRSFALSGLARTFEGTVNWRIRDSSDRVVATGFTTASIGTSAAWGTFQTTVTIPPSTSGTVKLEVFWSSPRDGGDEGIVGIPLQVR